MSANLPPNNDDLPFDFGPIDDNSPILPSDEPPHRDHIGHRDHRDHSLRHLTGSEDSLGSTDSETSMRSVPSVLSMRSVQQAYEYANEGRGLNGCVFRLARGLVTLEGISVTTKENRKELLRAWHQSTNAIACVDDDGLIELIRELPFCDLWAEFLDVVDKVKQAVGEGPMHDAIAAALDAPNPPAAMQYDCDRVRLLVRLCRELQRQKGSQPFYISTRAAGAVMGVDNRTAGKKLNMLCKDGVLSLVSKGGRFKGKKSATSTFHYLPPLNDFCLVDDIPY